MKRLAALVGAAALLLAGCGGTVSTAATPDSPAASPGAAAPSFTGPTKTYVSAQLGLVFSYPADWRLKADDIAASFSANGTADVGVEAPAGAQRQGVVSFQVESDQIYDQKPPLPYASVGRNAARVAQRREDAKEHPSTRWSLGHVGGLRLLVAERSHTVPSPFGGAGRWQERSLYSGASSTSPYPTEVTIDVSAPRGRTRAADSTLRAILSTVRFSTPTGGWAGS